ncbi:hypothetical protein NIIDMKKI_12340 [Mycobacterium kansasii]|nr:hypothetical protein NIIDMKKI_12340 [Mycobacterium kansasii]
MAAQQCSDAPTDIPAAVAEDGATGIAEPIAVIGIGCRFPGADGPAAFWQLLRDGVDAVTETPPDRRDPDASGNGGTRRGGFLEQIDRFDANFFGISPHEAGRMDPGNACFSKWRGRLWKTPGRCRSGSPAVAPACSSASRPTTTAACSMAGPR